MKRSELREAARLELDRRFPGVSVVKSQGIVPGARLLFSENGREREAAVRTSKDRKVGLLRDQNGQWRTVTSPRVGLVLVAVPSADESYPIEILAFDPKKLVVEFDRKSRHADRKSGDRGPVFLKLDKHERGRKLVAGLAQHAVWHRLVKCPENFAVSDVAVSSTDDDQALAALEIIRKCIAQSLNVEPDRINLSFQFSIKEKS